LAEQTNDEVYDIAANIIEKNPQYGVADVGTIGQDELVGNKQEIRIVNHTHSESKTPTVQEKVKAAAKNVTKEEAAPAPKKSADSADDFDNI